MVLRHIMHFFLIFYYMPHVSGQGISAKQTFAADAAVSHQMLLCVCTINNGTGNIIEIWLLGPAI